MYTASTGLRIDLGCGSAKKEGTLGVDIQPAPGVDYVLDLEKKPLPFDDGSVSYVHSSHFLEHVEDPSKIFSEVGRVCADNARIEIWTPYAWSNPAFIIGHKFFYAEDVYMHMCVWYFDFWRQILGSRWILEEFQYVVDARTLRYLNDRGVSLDFAIRHLQNVVTEFCTYITVSRSGAPDAPPPPVRRTFSLGRHAPRYEIKADSTARALEDNSTGGFDEATESAIEEAVRAFAKGDALPAL